MEACNLEIQTKLKSSVDLVDQLGLYLIAAGGKRFRPLLLLAAARLCGYIPQNETVRRDVRLATCVEFIHTATLLHDDVVDDSKLRRGAASANALFGNQASVLVGDFLFARSFQLMTLDGSNKVLSILSSASATLAEGEVLQMSVQNELSTPVDVYLEIIHAKTAALFSASCQVGAVVADASEVQEKALHSYGAHLGMAFQLADDALDYSADQMKLGKTVGDDLREGKITLPLLYAFHAGNAEEKRFWERVIEEKDIKEDDLQKAVKIIAERHGIEETFKKAQEYAVKANMALSIFPESKLRTLLENVAYYAGKRNH
ncbi:polyprenyl synthetase family protein [Acetobacteraceae bacterium]|nr:polyprenyl synthetase family protein [Acetobacteraceae bacterium]